MTPTMCAAERLTYTEIRERLNLTDEDVLRLLHSLSLAKFKILGKEPAGKTLSKNDTFFFNEKFVSALRRIRVRPGRHSGLQQARCFGSPPLRWNLHLRASWAPRGRGAEECLALAVHAPPNQQPAGLQACRPAGSGTAAH